MIEQIPSLEIYLEEIEQELKSQIGDLSGPYKPMYQMMHYHFGWIDDKGQLIDDPKARGKRFRPALMLLVCDGLSGRYKHALPAAAAVEIFHNFSLIHDDIEDHDVRRRHRPSVWKLWGVEQAINTGDAMLILAELAALRLQRHNISHQKVIQVLEILNKAFLEITCGQYSDISFEKKFDVSLEEYLEMISKKTASLVAGSCQIGALLATEDEDIITSFRDFGFNLGMAYQIYDDICGIWETEKKTGKLAGGDIRKKKKTLPVIYTYLNLKDSDRKIFKDIYRKSRLNNQDLKTILRFLNQVGAQDYTLSFLNQYLEATFKKIEGTSFNQNFIERLKSLVKELIKI